MSQEEEIVQNDQNQEEKKEETEEERIAREKREENEKREEFLATKAAILFVHGLDKRLDEGTIYKLFEKYGVSYIKIAKEDKTAMSLGYAFVGFLNREKAGQALEEVNYTRIMNKTVRLSWYDRTVNNARKHPENNIFVKNIPKNVSSKEFYDYYVRFGKILAAKIAEDPDGDSLGYGYVLYNEAECAKKAIEETNGKLWKDSDMKLYVCQFERKRPRKPLRFNNLYVRNIPKDWDLEQLKKYFSKFGEISSAIIRSPNKERVAKKTPPMISDNIFEHQYGFVCFKSIDGPAETAVMKVPYLKLHDEEYNKKVEENVEIFKAHGITEENAYKCTCYVYEYNLEEKMKTEEGLAEIKKGFEKLMKFYDGHYVVRNVEDRLHCCRAMKKKEREKLLRFVGERLKQKVRARYRFCNLYVKHLPDDFDNNKLVQVFGKYGPIRSARVLRSDTHHPKFKFITRPSHVFAYVCYLEPQQAKKARKYLNGKEFIKNGPRLYVDYHQPKRERMVFLKLKMVRKLKEDPNSDMKQAQFDAKYINSNVPHPAFSEFLKHYPMPSMIPSAPSPSTVNQNIPSQVQPEDKSMPPGHYQLIQVGPNPQMIIPVVSNTPYIPFMPRQNVNINQPMPPQATNVVVPNVPMMPPHMPVPYGPHQPMIPFNPNVPNVPIMPVNANVINNVPTMPVKNKVDTNVIDTNANVINTNVQDEEPEDKNIEDDLKFNEIDFNYNPFNDGPENENENVPDEQEKENKFDIPEQEEELKPHPIFDEINNFIKEKEKIVSDKLYTKLLENKKYNDYQHLFPKIVKAMLRLRYDDVELLCSDNNLFVTNMDKIIPLAEKASEEEIKQRGEEDIWKIGIGSHFSEEEEFIFEDETKKPKLDFNQDINWENVLGDFLFTKKKRK